MTLLDDNHQNDGTLIYEEFYLCCTNPPTFFLISTHLLNDRYNMKLLSRRLKKKIARR